MDMKFKFNGGLSALLCSGCSVIIKTGKDFTDREKSAFLGDTHLQARYCKRCKMKTSKSVKDGNSNTNI